MLQNPAIFHRIRLKSYRYIIVHYFQHVLQVSETGLDSPVITVQTSKSEAFPSIASRSGAQEVGMHGPLELAIAMREQALA